jgi:hypothetical protein
MHPIFSIVHKTIQGESNISNTMVSSIKSNCGKYKFHLLNNLCATPGTKFLAVGSSHDLHIAAALYKNNVDAYICTQWMNDTMANKFRNTIGSMQGSKFRQFSDPQDLLVELKTQKENDEKLQFDVVYLGYYSPSNMFSKLNTMGLLSESCIILYDDIQIGNRMNDLMSLIRKSNVIFYQEFFSKYPIDSNENIPEKNPNTWGSGIAIAALKLHL